MKKLNYGLFAMLLSIFALVSCEKDDDPEPTPQNIVELAQATPSLSTLVEAVTYAELGGVLSGTTEYTVFAPTNDAFDALFSALGINGITDLDKGVVERILLYHVVAGNVTSDMLSTDYYGTAATFGNTNSPLDIYVAVDGSAVSINKESKVTSANIEASNGVVHVIDKVLTLPSVVTTALNNPNFSVLVQALTRDDLGVDYVSILSGDGPFTVFAPTNDAFTALLSELGVSNLSDIDAATLNAVLQYHVVNGANVLAGDLSNGQSVETFGGGTFTIDLMGGAKINDESNRTTNIIVTDVQADNGVVHAIDRVLLPN